MALVPEQTARGRPRFWTPAGLRAFFRTQLPGGLGARRRVRFLTLPRLRSFLRAQMPQGLYARALIIMIAPMVLLQSVLTFVFLQRHWEMVTERLSSATVDSIAMLVDVYKNYPQDGKFQTLTNIADQDLGLKVQIVPHEQLPMAASKPFFDLLDRTLSDELRQHVGRPFWIDTVGNSDFVDIRIKLDDAVMHVLAKRSQTYASNSHIFLFWMLGTSLVLLTVAILFLRNQIKPVVLLSEAAESFGKGRPAPEDFRPRGAREVRQAAIAFLEMRDRIERHVEQRTTMLAGVSHDLRTILTRFRLQLAMLGTEPEIKELCADVDEMQAMLEDYMAFAKGDSGEETSPIDIAELLRDVSQQAQAAAPANGAKSITVELPRDALVVPLKRHAFKRAVANLVNNAARFAERIEIRAGRRRGSLLITVEDNGPGIPPDEREQVFRPFYRLDDARNQDSGSTGLGLAIARDIARLHGGDIKLGDSKLGGLKVVLTVPV